MLKVPEYDAYIMTFDSIETMKAKKKCKIKVTKCLTEGKYFMINHSCRLR